MREVGRRLRPRLEARHADVQPSLPVVQLRVELVNPLRHVRGQHFDHQLLRMHRARAVARDFHPRRRCAAARWRQHALALDLDHAGAAIAVGAHAFLVAKMRNVDAVALRRLDDRLTALGAELDTVQEKLGALHVERFFIRSVHSASSWGKYLITHVIGLGAACPSPQIDASIMTWESSASSAVSHFGVARSPTAFWVPTRQGVH